jgi:hypothetical protein
VVQFHTEKERSFAKVFDLELFLHLRLKTKGVFANNDEVIDVRKNPEGARGHPPEDARIGDRNREANRYEEGAEATIQGQRSLLEPIDGFAELEDNVLVGEVPRGRKHEDLLHKVTREEGTLHVQLMDKVTLIDGMRDKKTEGGWLASGSVL